MNRSVPTDGFQLSDDKIISTGKLANRCAEGFGEVGDSDERDYLATDENR